MNSIELKDYLVAHFRAEGVRTTAQDWKRLSKKKDAQGRVVRQFSCATLEGVVEVVEDNGSVSVNLSSSQTPAPTASKVDFIIPQFSPELIEAAARVRQYYLDIAQDKDRDVDDPAEEIPNAPDYEQARPALGTQLAFYFPRFTYDNDGISSSISLSDPVGDLCVSILDPDPDAEVDLYHSMLLFDDFDQIGISSMDEYHFEFNDKKLSIAKAIQALLDTGMVYDHARAQDGREGCLFLSKLSHLPAAPTKNKRSPHLM